MQVKIWSAGVLIRKEEPISTHEHQQVELSQIPRKHQTSRHTEEVCLKVNRKQVAAMNEDRKHSNQEVLLY